MTPEEPDRDHKGFTLNVVTHATDLLPDVQTAVPRQSELWRYYLFILFFLKLKAVGDVTAKVVHLILVYFKALTPFSPPTKILFV